MQTRGPRAADPVEVGAPPADAVASSRVGGLRRVPGLVLASVLLVLLQVALGIAGAAAPLVGAREPFAGTWESLIIRGAGTLGDLVSHWQRWDALWYQHIAESGYQAANGSTAFFPLYPLLSRAVSIVVAGSVPVAELLVSAVTFVLAMSLLWRLVEGETGNVIGGADGSGVSGHRVSTVPLLTVLLIAFFPTAFFLLGPFSESLFLLLTMASLWCARTGRPWMAGAIGFLAGLTRAQGVLLVLPLAYEHLRHRDTFRWIRRRGGGRPTAALLAAALPLIGFLLFTVAVPVVLGQKSVLLGTEAPWGYRLAAPWQVINASLTYIDTVRNTNDAYVEVLNLCSLLAFAALALVGARRMPFAYTLYALQSLVLLATREMWFSPLMSVSRYVLVLFPCFLVAARWLAPRPRLAATWLLVSLALQLALFQYFVRWGFVA